MGGKELDEKVENESLEKEMKVDMEVEVEVEVHVKVEAEVQEERNVSGIPSEQRWRARRLNLKLAMKSGIIDTPHRHGEREKSELEEAEPSTESF